LLCLFVFGKQQHFGHISGIRDATGLKRHQFLLCSTYLFTRRKLLWQKEPTSFHQNMNDQIYFHITMAVHSNALNHIFV